MIINLTQHCATREQISQGAVDLPPAQRGHLIETFEKTSGIGIEDVHVSRIKGSANSRFTLTCDLGS